MSKKTMASKKKESNGSILSVLINKIKSIALAARSFLFACFYSKMVEAIYNEGVVPFRKEVFADIGTVIPSDKQSGQIKILEVGVGPGFNLHFYPKQCRLIALDKNHYFKNMLLENLRKHPGIVLERFVNECGENMSSISSNSVDVVVSSNIHCSVDNSHEVLKEIKRVLIPGGRYYFFEHNLDEPNTLRYKFQMFINKIGIWRLMFHGCHFQNFEEKISKANFFKYKTKRYIFPNESWNYYLLYPLASHIGGCAVKK